MTLEKQKPRMQLCILGFLDDHLQINVCDHRHDHRHDRDDVLSQGIQQLPSSWNCHAVPL